MGFPIEHKHKLCCLRQELIDSFVDSRYMMFIKYAAFHLQQLNLRKNEDILKSAKDKIIEVKKDNNNEENEKDEEGKQLETEEAKKMVESITEGSKIECKCKVAVEEMMWLNVLFCFFLVEESTKNIVKTACIAVGSLKETEFDIRFNPDVYSPGIRHSETLDPPLPKQRQLVKDAADFLLTVQIPTFVCFFSYLLVSRNLTHLF